MGHYYPNYRSNNQQPQNRATAGELVSTQGLVRLWIADFSGGYFAVGNDTVAAPTKAQTDFGQKLNGVNAHFGSGEKYISYSVTAKSIAPDIVTGASLLFPLIITSTSTWTQILSEGYGRGTTDADHRVTLYTTGAANTIQAAVKHSGGTGVASTAKSITPGKPMMIGIRRRFSGSTVYCQLYVDGIPIGEGSSSYVWTNPYNTVNIGKRSGETGTCDFHIPGYASFNRALSDAEFAYYSTDRKFWELAQPRERRIWVPSVSSGVSGTLTPTLGAVTSTISGNSSVTGTLSASLEACISTIAGTPIVTGSSSFSLDPVTSSISGNVGSAITGDVNAAVANVTSSISGNVTVNGALIAILENITMSAGGNSTVTGTLSGTLQNVTSQMNNYPTGDSSIRTLVGSGI